MKRPCRWSPTPFALSSRPHAAKKGVWNISVSATPFAPLVLARTQPCFLDGVDTFPRFAQFGQRGANCEPRQRGRYLSALRTIAGSGPSAVSAASVHSATCGKLPPQQKFLRFAPEGGVVFRNSILDCCRFTYNCGRFTCDCARLSCGGGRLHLGRCLSGGGHVGSSQPDANFHFGLFATGG
jgi:hypothetical protein